MPNPLPDQSGALDNRRALFVVVRLDAFQMRDGQSFDPQFVSAKRPVYDNQDAAEVEAARLTLQAQRGVHYFVRRLVHPNV